MNSCIVDDVLEQCLVAGCVLGVVRLKVCLIASLLPWSSGNQSAVNVAPFVNQLAMGGPMSINLDRLYCTPFVIYSNVLGPFVTLNL
jgi:hypothetical protein